MLGSFKSILQAFIRKAVLVMCFSVFVKFMHGRCWIESFPWGFLSSGVVWTCFGSVVSADGFDWFLPCEKSVCWHFCSGLRVSVSTVYSLSGAIGITVRFPNAFRAVLMAQGNFKGYLKSFRSESCCCNWAMLKDLIALVFIPQW